MSLASKTGEGGKTGELERDDAGVGSAFIVRVVDELEYPFVRFAFVLALEEALTASATYGCEYVRDRG